MATVPPTSRMALATITSWECRDSRNDRRRSDATSRMVKKPMPPEDDQPRHGEQDEWLRGGADEVVGEEREARRC